MSNDEDCFAGCFQFGQQLAIEDLLEVRILVRCPFIENIERTIFEQRNQQRQAFTLPAR